MQKTQENYLVMSILALVHPTKVCLASRTTNALKESVI